MQPLRGFQFFVPTIDYFTHLSYLLLSIHKCFREQKCFVCPFTEHGSAQSVARGSGRVGAGRPCGSLHGSSRSVTSEQLSTGTFSDNLRRTLQRGFASLEHGVRKGIPLPHRQLWSLQLGATPAPSPARLHGLAPPAGSLGVGPRRKEGYSLCSSRCLDVGRQVPKALLTRKESRENELYL